MNQTKIKKDNQDRNSTAWYMLCAYIDQLEKEESEEFFPAKYLKELYHEIRTLPESIGRLKKIKKMHLYGSSLVSIPPEIGDMTALEVFTPYTSENLCWFPYEITRCKNLKESTVSTRVLYGNKKNRKLFPDLTDNPVTYHSLSIKCSICNKEIGQHETHQYWISLWVGTDVLPLLVNLCSFECSLQLPKGAEGYLPYAHKGGSSSREISALDFI